MKRDDFQETSVNNRLKIYPIKFQEKTIKVIDSEGM